MMPSCERVSVWTAVACGLLVACSSSGSGGAAGSAGMNTSGSGNTSGGADSGGSDTSGGASGNIGGSGAAGKAGAGAAGKAGAGSTEPAACSGLQRAEATQVYYMPPDRSVSVTVAGNYLDGQGLLLALHENRSIRLVAVDETGTASELINESEYQPSWSLEPKEVAAFVSDNEVDLLVTDNANLALIRKQASKVTVTPLADTSLLDLHVLGFAPTTSGMLALYWKGDRATGTDEILTAFDPASMKKTTRTFHGDAGLVSVSSASGAWLSAERLDTSSDCQQTAQTVDCGASTVPAYDCTWHLDVWKVTDASFTTAAPLATFDVPGTIAARCRDTTPFGLATYASIFGAAPGVGSHHVAALDSETQGLALALQRPFSAQVPGVQFELLDASANRIIDGTTASFDTTEASTWLAARAENLFICSGNDCAASTSSKATNFKFPASPKSVVVSAIALRPDGLTLVGANNGNTFQEQHASCTP